jgi:MFS family permease
VKKLLLYRNKPFAVFWLTQFLSEIGNALYLVILPLWVLELTQSPLQTGFSFFCATLPMLVTLPYAGVIVDRFGIRKVLLCSDFGRALLIFMLSCLNENTAAFIPLLALGLGVGNGFFFTAFTAATKLAVADEDIATANSLRMFSWSAAILLAPALASWVIVRVPLNVGLILNGGSFLLAAAGALILKVRSTTGTLTSHTNALCPLAQLRSSWQIILASAPLRSSFCLHFFTTLSIGANAFLIAIVVNDSDLPRSILPLYMASQGAGMVCGSLLVSRLVRKYEGSIFPWQLLLIMWICLFSIALNASRWAVITAASLWVFGCLFSCFLVHNRTKILQATPIEQTGKISAFSTMVGQVATLLSSGLGMMGATFLSASLAMNLLSYSLLGACGIALFAKRQLLETNTLR